MWRVLIAVGHLSCLPFILRLKCGNEGMAAWYDDSVVSNEILFCAIIFVVDKRSHVSFKSPILPKFRDPNKQAKLCR